MLVVHISFSPLAGAPIRIVNALNAYTDITARLINTNPIGYGKRTFPEDLIWEKDKEECLDLLTKADIIHCYHWIDFDSDKNPLGVSLKKITPKAKFVRMFESDLDFVTKNNPSITAQDIINDPTAKIVIPHYPERTFLDAFIVPNIIPIDDPILMPKEVQNDKTTVFFSASSCGSMWCERWNTKGLPEVETRMKKLQETVDFNFQLVTNTPYEECQRLKQQSDIIIGDTTSGSYHLTDLERLSQGKPVFTYLDSRTQLTLTNLLGCKDLPFINTRLEEIDLPITEMIHNQSLRREIGAFSRQWIEKYYCPQKLVKFFEEAYEKILNDEPIHRQDYLSFPKAKHFLYNTLYDQQWETRRLNNQPVLQTPSRWSLLFQKIKSSNGRRRIYICGLKVLSYKKKNCVGKPYA